MSGARTSTTLDIKVNGRDLQRLDRILKDVFSSRATRGFERSTRDVSRSLQEMHRIMERLTQELRRQRDGSRQYRDWARDLAEARREAERLRAELERMRAAGGGAGGGAGGAGAGAGDPRRRRWGYQTPQAPMPTAGALAGAMGAVPFVGAVLGGSMMASYQMYGSALQYQTAYRDTWSALGPQGRQAIGMRLLDPGHKGSYVDASGKVVTAKDTERIEQTGREAVRGEAGVRMMQGYANTVLARPMDYWFGTELERRVNAGADQRIREMKEGRGDWRQGVFEAVGDAGISVGKVLAPDATNAMIGRGAGVKWEEGRAARYNVDTSRAGYWAAGRKYGVNPTQALQEAGQLSQAAGAVAGAEQYDAARAAQLIFGVGLQQSGQIMRAGRYTGAGEGMELVAKMIGNAVAVGMNNSEIAEYLQGMQGLLKQQMDLGQSANADAFLSMQRRLSLTLQNGYMGGRLAAGFAQGASQVGMKGAGGAEEFMLMRAMGYTGKGGMEEYFKVLGDLQDPFKAIEALPAYLEQFKGSGLGKNTQSAMIQRALQSVGVTVGRDVTDRLASGVSVQEVMPELTNAAQLSQMGAVHGRAAAGMLIGEAGMEGERIVVGQRVTGQVQKLNGLLITLADTFATYIGPAVEKVIDIARGGVDKGIDAYASGSYHGGGG